MNGKYTRKIDVTNKGNSSQINPVFLHHLTHPPQSNIKKSVRKNSNKMKTKVKIPELNLCLTPFNSFRLYQCFPNFFESRHTKWKSKISRHTNQFFFIQFEKENFDSFKKENFDSWERKILTVWKEKFWKSRKENFDGFRDTVIFLVKQFENHWFILWCLVFLIFTLYILTVHTCIVNQNHKRKLKDPPKRRKTQKWLKRTINFLLSLKVTGNSHLVGGIKEEVLLSRKILAFKDIEENNVLENLIGDSDKNLV